MEKIMLTLMQDYASPEINVVVVQTETGFAGSPEIEDLDYRLYDDWN